MKISCFAVCLRGATVFFRIGQSPEVVKKSVKARAGALGRDERLLLDDVIAAVQASTGLGLELVEDPAAAGR